MMDLLTHSLTRTLLKLEVGACSIGEMEEGEKGNQINNAASMVRRA